MKISRVHIQRVHGTREITNTEPNTPQAHPIDIYSERTPSPPLIGPRPVSALFVEIETDAGLSGIFGPTKNGASWLSMIKACSFCMGPKMPVSPASVSISTKSALTGRGPVWGADGVRSE